MSTTRYFPFATGAGSSVNETQWQAMARYWLRDGVIEGNGNDNLVYADSTGMQVKVKSGAAFIQGFYYDFDASTGDAVLAIAAADPTNPRIDRVVLRVSFSPTDTVGLFVKTGTPGATPSAPALVQSASVWEVSLAQVAVAAAAGTIAAGNVTDERGNANVCGYASQPIPLVVANAAGLPATFPVGGQVYRQDTKVLYKNDGTFAAPVFNPVSVLTTRNLLVNGGFEVWQRGTAPAYANNAFAADRWQGTNAGTGAVTSVGQDATNVDSGSRFGMQVVVGAGALSAIGSGGIPTNNVAVFQKLEDFYQLRGQTVSFSKRVRSSVAGTAALAIVDSGGTVTWGSVVATGTTYATLTATATIGAASSGISVYVFFGTASCTYTLDNAMLVTGSVAVSYVPLTPAEEWERCQRYYEILSPNVALVYWGIAQDTTTTDAVSPHSYKVRKAVTPTVTVVNPSDFDILNPSSSANENVTSFNGATSVDDRTCALNWHCAGGGLTIGDAGLVHINNTAGLVTVEANP